MDILILSLASVAGGIVYVIDKKISDGKHDADAYTVLTLSLNLLISLPLLLFNFYITDNPIIWLFAILSGVLYGLSRTFLYKAYKSTDASSVSIIHKLNIVLGAILGIVILQEEYSGIAYLGLILITISSVLIVYKGGRIRIDSGALYTIIMVILTSVAAVLDKIALEGFSAYTYVVINAFFSVIFFTGKKGIILKAVNMFKDHRFAIIARTVLVMLSWLVFIIILQNSKVSVSFPIYKSLSLIVPVILGIVVLKERTMLWQKIIGMILGVVGIILVAYF